MKIQIDLSEEENKIVSLFKINNDLNNKEEAIKKIIRDSKEGVK